MDRQQELLQHLRAEDLPDNLKFVAEVMGLDVVRRLIAECAGLPLYVPRVARMKQLIARYVDKSKPSPRELQQLARDLNITIRHLRKIISENGTQGVHP